MLAVRFHMDRDTLYIWLWLVCVILAAGFAYVVFNE